MKSAIWLTILFSLLAVFAAPALSAEPVGSVHGSGIYGTTRGEFPNHQPYIDTITVNATLCDDGSADGRIAWTSIYNGGGDQGQGTSGWFWHIRAEFWVLLDDGSILLAGSITQSQLKEEVGQSVHILLYDGGTDNLDTVNYNEIKGNIRFEGP